MTSHRIVKEQAARSPEASKLVEAACQLQRCLTPATNRHLG
jgi:hypothetical protein